MSENNMTKLVSAGSYSEAEQIIEMLRQNGIAAMRKGTIMDVYSSNSIMGEDIFVASKQEKAARELLEDFQPIKTGSSREKRKMSKNQTIFIWVLLAIIIFLCIVLPILVL
ncbi:putative signal transducing protein [Ruminococcus sp. 5_1_39BFAA]|uniref:putative signal transducing protein n=1 Tax=Ruminococcus sp. 5_1_39BFAA TaxID=457412 RepID=UPI0035638D51